MGPPRLVLEATKRVGGRITSEPRNRYWLNFGVHVLGGAGSATGRLLQEPGYHVCSAVDLVQALLEAQRTRTLNAARARLDKPALLICDELGYIPLEQVAARLFLQP